MRKIALLLLLCAVAVSCGGAARKVRLAGIGSFDRHAWSGADLTLEIENMSGHNIAIERAGVVFYYQGACVGEALLMGRAVAARRSLSPVATRWKFRVPDPAAAFVLTRRIEERNYEGITLDIRAKVRVGWASRSFSVSSLPVSDFIRTFENPQILN